MWWLVLKVLWTLIPAIIRAVKEQRIKEAAADEVVEALHNRIEEARRAVPPAVDVDPNNRARRL